ncbi:MAG: hypothetical protein ACJA2S_002595, partial [Cyclobacteriaceae bacterium]
MKIHNNIFELFSFLLIISCQSVPDKND